MEKNLRSELHTLVGKEMRLGKRASMWGGVSHQVEAHKKAKEDLQKFLKENPSMIEYLEEVEDHFCKKLY